MSLEIPIFVLCLLGWLGALRLLHQKRTLAHIFGALIMSVWLYVSLMLILFTLEPPLEVWLAFGAAPVFLIAYGYRLYEHYQGQGKGKNDHKNKRSNPA